MNSVAELSRGNHVLMLNHNLQRFCHSLDTQGRNELFSQDIRAKTFSRREVCSFRIWYAA